MPDREKVAKWFEFDYLPRVCAYRKDCKIGCDACIPKHDGDNYCDIDMLSKVLSLLKEQEVKPMTEYDNGWDCPRCGLKLVGKTASGYPCDEFDLPNDEIVKYCQVCGQAVKWNF